VAADLRTNQVFVPIQGNTDQTAGGRATCSKGKDVFGLAGSDALGCIAIYTGTSDVDDAVRTFHWGRRDAQ
jgi:hypothetical protein